MSGSVKWNELVIRKAVHAHITAGMKTAMAFAERKCKKSISRGNKSGKNPSEPNTPPKVRTGVLRSHVSGQVVSRTASLDSVSGFLGIIKGTGIQRGKARKKILVEQYADYLERGTSKMQPRPFLRPTIGKNKKRLLQLIARGK